MTATEVETAEARAPARGLLRRAVADITQGTGRTVDVRIVRYGEQIQHNDGHGGVAPGVMYREEWVAGAFAHQVKATGRENAVLVNVEHEEGLRGVVGHGIALREDQDSFYGSFMLHDNHDGDKALMLVREGILNTVSLEAKPLKSVRTKDGVVQRVKAHLVNIALTRFGAYPSAVVLAVREGEDEEVMIDEEFLPVDFDPELVRRLQAQGISLPDRYTAHPEETGTPSEEGTPEDGTGQTQETTSLEE